MFPVFSCRRSHENFNFQSLLYSQEKIVNKLDSAEYQWLFEFEYGTSESKKCWAYYFRDQNMPYPADEMNFEKFKKEFSEKNSSLEIAKTYTLLPLYKMLYFFPDLFALDHTVKILQNNGVPVSEDGETQCFKISV